MLAEPGAALVLADGTKIDPATGKPVRENNFVSVPNTTELRENYAAIQRRLTDLPLPPEKMHGLSVILMYKMVGIPDHEIAIAVGLTIPQVNALCMSDAFATMQQMLVDNIMAADGEDIRAMMRKNAVMGVQRMTQLINSDNEGIAYAAAKDSLDRDGFRPNDVVEHRHKLDGGLTIEIIKKDHTVQTPHVDVDFKDITKEIEHVSS